jgi:hypothetical protein
MPDTIRTSLAGRLREESDRSMALTITIVPDGRRVRSQAMNNKARKCVARRMPQT